MEIQIGGELKIINNRKTYQIQNGIFKDFRVEIYDIVENFEKAYIIGTQQFFENSFEDRSHFGFTVRCKNKTLTENDMTVGAIEALAENLEYLEEKESEVLNSIKEIPKNFFDSRKTKHTLFLSLKASTKFMLTEDFVIEDKESFSLKSKNYYNAIKQNFNSQKQIKTDKTKTDFKLFSK